MRTLPAVKTITDEPTLTDLVLKVNGVKIAARGGNWGMDDSRKRVSREHLEPYFRLHREANMNIIRNWVGQDTEETFFELADEYGMMVWNDFWASTQNYNVEPQDVPLFPQERPRRRRPLPQPSLHRHVVRTQRRRSPARPQRGPHRHLPRGRRHPLLHAQAPTASTSATPDPTSTSSPTSTTASSTKASPSSSASPAHPPSKALKASIAPADQWPIGDAWAYHDWHQSGNGLVEPFMQKVEEEFGAATSLADFERKAQMLSYNEHRAIFEGFNQHLWTPNSGRMLWMTQPAWPSNMWQIFSSDYDTPGSFYGVKKACEPMHVQLDLSDYTVAAVNITNLDGGQVTVIATVYSLSNQTLATREQSLTLGPDRTVPAFPLDLAPLFAQQRRSARPPHPERSSGQADLRQHLLARRR